MQINKNKVLNEWTREILDYYHGLPGRSSREAIVEMLKEPQGIHGCISLCVLKQAVKAIGIWDSMVWAMCKRHPSLKTTPYSHEIILCTRKSCVAKGSLTVMDGLRKRLGVGRNGISEDGTACFRTRNCLKSYRRVPNVMVDGRMYSGLGTEAILKELKHR